MRRNKTAVKKYIVTLSNDERDELTTLIQTGKHATRKLLMARILLKADTSDEGEEWSDSQIAEALEPAPISSRGPVRGWSRRVWKRP